MNMRDRLKRDNGGKFLPKSESPQAGVSESDTNAGAALEVVAPPQLVSSASQVSSLDKSTVDLVNETAPVQPKRRVVVAQKVVTPMQPSPAPKSEPTSAKQIGVFVAGACATVLLGILGYQFVQSQKPKPAPIMPPDKASQPVTAPQPKARSFLEI